MVVFKLKNNEVINVFPVKDAEESSNKYYYNLIDVNKQDKIWMRLKLIDNHFLINDKDPDIIDSDEDISDILDELVLEIIEKEQSGTENSESSSEVVNPYNPDNIKVQTKAFNIKLISDMIDNGDIDLSPDFQRNFVWNPIQKSRLIESILLRIPLPMFYFSENEEGLITVVDGLQRLTSIKDFIDNKFPLKGLEYLSANCEGRYYKDDPLNRKSGIDSKYFRWFNMTQFTVNVIDPSSPSKVKYDIFKRINTGGKPLNNQEIRNCLASKNLRETLREMVDLPEFKSATDRSIRPVRMEDKEVALRFICFSNYYNDDQTLNNYNGNMEYSLDDITEKLGRERKEILTKYVKSFSNSMKNAEYLFGKYAFRKIRPKDLEPNSYKQLINKALFVSCSILLSQYNHIDIKVKNEPNSLAEPLAKLINEDQQLFYFLSYGTNGKVNLQYTFTAITNLLNNHLNY